MSSTVLVELSKALGTIDRPGSFCVSGSVPAVLPGMEVHGLGPIGFPLTAHQAKELMALGEQAPYGKGEETLVDTSVRNVWRLKPEQFALKSPDWEPFLRQTVHKVQKELGLEKQKLQSHLYELLLYEPGSFFLPHRDGEKVDRMVATLVIVLPSSFEGGELVVRHEGQEQTIDFGGDDSAYRIHFAAFYADCEHEIRPLRQGHRLCLVYNLTLAKSKKIITAPRTSEHVDKITEVLHRWAEVGEPHKFAITLEHQYTQDGLAWDALKGVDRAQARALLEAAGQAGFQAHLALLTLYESGSAEYAGGDWGRRRRGYQEEDSGPHEMGEIEESSLTAEHWIDSEGKPLPLGQLSFTDDEVLDPVSLQEVEPEEEFEGYTGNAGMTLQRWYRHAAVILWPNKKRFEVLCDAGNQAAVAGLEQMVNQWRRAAKKDAPALRSECLDFAAAIIARWPEKTFGWGHEETEPLPLFRLLAELDEPALIRSSLAEVMIKDVSVDPGKTLAEVCRKYGWRTFQPELESVFERTTTNTLERNVRLLEQLSLARAGKQEGWLELCRSLAETLVGALEEIDHVPATQDYRVSRVKRDKVLAGLARSLLATDQEELLARLVDHAMSSPEQYPLMPVHIAALTALQPWLEKNVKEPSPGLEHWLASCRQQLEALTARKPPPPGDFRRPAALSCKCADCAELKRFLQDPAAPELRFRAVQHRRNHLESIIRTDHCDLNCKTERGGSPHTLVCTKNDASYRARLAKYHQDREHLATVLAIQKSVRK